MQRNRETIRVFISSTSEDLKDCRAVARNVVLELGWMPLMMEHFGAIPNPTVEACCNKVRKANIVLLIVAFRRGWVPTVEQGGSGKDTITALELACAREQEIPVLALLAGEGWPGSLWENEQSAREWVASFRANLNLPAVLFEYEKPSEDSQTLPQFKAIVKQALLAQKERLIDQWASRGGGEGIDYFSRALKGLLKGNHVPFLGAGVYGAGPLSPAAIAKELAPDDESADSLATAAEYQWRYLGDRGEFLAELREVLTRQAGLVSRLPVHDMLLQLPRPPFLVSTTSDLVFETLLEQEGRDHAVVTHVLRSDDGEHRGKIAVFRGGSPELQPADQLTFGEDEIVVYKPMGSPFLNDRLAEGDALDTVVVTESDHAAFLRLLANEKTGIPLRFARHFTGAPLLFVGYALDVWQYRLMMQVFQHSGRFAGRRTTLAVRDPGSSIEKLAWTRLGADLIPMEPNLFAERVMRERGAA
jgi:hypothetical protein